MNSSGPSSSHPIKRLARRLEVDIAAKGLLPGDRYLTAAEAGKEHGVSAATANRAMKLLAAKELLCRERSRGTFVGPAATVNRAIQVRTILVLWQEGDDERFSDASSIILKSLRDELGEVNIHFVAVPAESPVEYLRDFLSPTLSAGHLAGVVAITCQSEVYQYLATLDVPLVINGSLYSDGRLIPSVDTDNRQAGRLLARYLFADRRHQRVALLCGNESLPGEHDFHDGVCEVLAELNVQPTALLVRVHPSTDEGWKSQVRQLLQLESPPTAFIVRPGERVQGLCAVLRDVSPESSIELACDGYGASGSQRHARVLPKLTRAETMKIIGKMLGRLSSGLPLEQERVVIPVQLCRPERV